jgi:hypothetical protein
LGWEVIRRDAMLRVFSPTGSNVIFSQLYVLNHGFYGLLDFTDVWAGLCWLVFGVLSARFLNQDLQDFEDYCRGELNSPSHDTGAFPYFGINIVSLG